MEPVCSGISWSTSYGLGTIQVTFETLDWSQMWRYRNAYTLTCFSTRSYFMIYRLDIYLIVYFETCTVYICTPIYSRILAYWLMLSVLQTTKNKFYLILSYLNNLTRIFHKLRTGETPNRDKDKIIIQNIISQGLCQISATTKTKLMHYLINRN